MNGFESEFVGNASAFDRRSVLRRASGRGIALPSSYGTDHAIRAPAGGAALRSPIDPRLPAVKPGDKRVTLSAVRIASPVAPGMVANCWTYNGMLPGPVVRAVQGDRIDFELAEPRPAPSAGSAGMSGDGLADGRNDGQAARAFRITAGYPGAFIYHHGTSSPFLRGDCGMFGALIVDPIEGWTPAQEFVLVQSELYGNGAAATPGPAGERRYGLPPEPRCMLFNGRANQYVDEPIRVRAGKPLRLFVLNAGPYLWTSFHIAGAAYDRVLINANPAIQFFGLNTISIGPGDAVCLELMLDHHGTYMAVSSAFGHPAQSATALLVAS